MKYTLKTLENMMKKNGGTLDVRGVVQDETIKKDLAADMYESADTTVFEGEYTEDHAESGDTPACG